MTLDYYYGDQAEQFSFYRIPKVLFTDKRFKDISAEAKILYGLLLDRMSLSAKNGWLDQEGRCLLYTSYNPVFQRCFYSNTVIVIQYYFVSLNGHI